MGVERSTRSPANSFRVAGFIRDSDVVGVLTAFVSGWTKDQDLYSRSEIWMLYI
jgi:hypothetical protein